MLGVDMGYLEDADGLPLTSETFDLDQYIADNVPDPKILEYPQGRRAVTEMDPLLFGIIYAPHLIRNAQDEITLGDLHLELCRHAIEWTYETENLESRHSFIAGRGFGKSSWTFKILPMWAACHGHRKFVAAYSNSQTQAEAHLKGFRQLMDTSPLLRQDYPDVCTPMKRPNGNAISDSVTEYYAKSGFTIAAKGMDSSTLGMTNPDNERPDVILLDDIEKGEGTYTPYQARKRFLTLRDDIFPMNLAAKIYFVGTVTMPGSIVHDLVKSVVFLDEKPAEWVKEENFKVHYIKPIEKTKDGTGERSTWPGKFPLEFFLKQRHTAGYKKNYLNLPVSEGEEFWSESDFVYGTLPRTTRTILQIDPAVTSKQKSDYTAFAVVSFQPAYLDEETGKRVPAMCEVREVVAVKKPPEELRLVALRLINKHPDIHGIRIEVNQGGDTWKSVFKNMPVQVVAMRESVNKKVRATNLLNYYQNKRVYHWKEFRDLQEQMLAFPNVHHDDLIDAVGAGVHYLMTPKKKLGVSSATYRR
jgi:phage terminase large subunit-like protein